VKWEPIREAYTAVVEDVDPKLRTARSSINRFGMGLADNVVMLSQHRLQDIIDGTSESFHLHPKLVGEESCSILSDRW